MFVAIIQARMGSARLPGKVMKEILGKPLIEYLLERVSQSNYINKIILATTRKKEDDLLVKHVTNLGYDVFRGSEDDVLDRYYKAFLNLQKQERYKGILRLTGDCPLLQSDIIDRVILKFIEKDSDHVCLSEDFAEGLDTEIFKPSLLKEVYLNAKKDSQREHVMLYLSSNKEKYKMSKLENLTDDSKYRITVDESEDFIVVKTIIEEFIKNKQELNIENIKLYLDTKPHLFALNAKIIRNEGLTKSLKNDKEE